MRCQVEHKKKNSISKSNHVLFCLSYKHNKLLGWKNALNHNYKNNNGHNFQLKKSHLLTLSSPTEEVFEVNSQNQPVANLQVVDFHSQPREMPTPKPLNT